MDQLPGVTFRRHRRVAHRMGLAFHAVLLIYFYLDIGLVSTNVGKMRTPKFSRQTDCCPFLSVVPEHPPRANTTICRRCALRETAIKL